MIYVHSFRRSLTAFLSIAFLMSGLSSAHAGLIHDLFITSDSGNFNGRGIPSSSPVHAPNPVPVPSTMILFGTALAGTIAWRRKKAA